MAEFVKLFEPGRIGNMLVRNRIVMAAMGTHSVNFDSQMNDCTMHYYEARAKGGAGLIITQCVSGFRPTASTMVSGGTNSSSFPQAKYNLAEELRRIVPEFNAIVDRVEPRNALEAINEGAEIARKI